MHSKERAAVEALERTITEPPEGDPGILFTGGKDSMLLAHLVRERCDVEEMPPLLVVDTGDQYDEIYEFRERMADEWGLDYEVKRNGGFIDGVLNDGMDPRGYAGQTSCPDCGAAGSMSAAGDHGDMTCEACGYDYYIPTEYDDTPESWGSDADGVIPKYESCCGRLKIEPMGEFIAEGYRTLIVGRRTADVPGSLPVVDENYREPVPHTRVHPLADWSDAHVKAYTRKHAVPLPSLYEAGYEHTDCVTCTEAGEEGDDWSGVSPDERQQLAQLRDMGYM
jgi:3'-phosphoadenosine 5'-phosphosulfate sulfotransferase (PAPS reductase)/FAD synthetase